MYSIVETGGFQYKVELGKTVKLPSIADAAIGSELEIKSVLLYSNEGMVRVGTPVLEDAMVKIEVLDHDMSDKVVTFKKKRRTRYERKQGHRQDYTEVLIKEIRSGAETAVIDPQVALRARARITALNNQKAPKPGLTRKEKIAQGIPKPKKIAKNELRKAKEV